MIIIRSWFYRSMRSFMGLSSFLPPTRRILNTIHENRFIKVANETMCRPIRALTEARGYATSKHTRVFSPTVPSLYLQGKPTASQVSVEQVANTPAKSQVSSGSKRSSSTDTAPFSPRMDWPLQTGLSFLSPPFYLTSNSPFLCSYPAHTKSKNPARHSILPRTNRPSSLGWTG